MNAATKGKIDSGSQELKHRSGEERTRVHPQSGWGPSKEAEAFPSLHVSLGKHKVNIATEMKWDTVGGIAGVILGFHIVFIQCVP